MGFAQRPSGRCPAGRGVGSAGNKPWDVLSVGPGENDGRHGEKMLGMKPDPKGCPDP